MDPLNLPPYPFKIVQESGKLKIFDPVRRKYLVLTPEEWVRQHFMQFLIGEKKFPKGLFKIESGVNYNERKGRFDALVYDSNGNPLVLIECKAPEVAISKATFFQIARYNVKIKAPYLAVTNGMQHYFVHIDVDENKMKVLGEVPEYKYLVSK